MQDPFKSILDQSFKYVSCIATDVDKTWRRFGWCPTSAEEREQRQFRTRTRSSDALKASESVVPGCTSKSTDGWPIVRLVGEPQRS